jgi:hypothetical protein
MRSVLICYEQDKVGYWLYTGVEAGSITSTAAQQIAGGDEKGTQCPGV